MSYEEKIAQKEEAPPEKLNISLLQFFWKANPISDHKEGLPGFLREVELFKTFSLGELKKLSECLHFRHFENREVIFRRGQIGLGLYLIYSGRVNLLLDDEHSDKNILQLKKLDHFGEMALVRTGYPRDVSAVACGGCKLLGMFRPDMDDLVEGHPDLAAKIYRAISSIIAERFFLLGQEYVHLKHQLEKA